jgi:putative pyruvate formate lyase activating enzyme
VETNALALKEMFRQVGPVELKQGVIQKGMVIRHLILPNNISGTKHVMKFIAENLNGSSVSLMSQYLPAYRAGEFAELSRRINSTEYRQAINELDKFGIINGWVQEGKGLKQFAGENLKPT